MKRGDSTTGIGTSFVEQAMLQTSLGSPHPNAHLVLVVLEKYISHLLSEQLSISRPFHSLIVF